MAQVAKRFGFTDTEFSYIKARHVIADEAQPLPRARASTPSISNNELKSHYHRLIADNHPDKLIARGVPKEFIAIATKKAAAINEAYDAIAKERGIRMRVRAVPAAPSSPTPMTVEVGGSYRRWF